MHINDYDVIILDCDGVIFNSNLLKIAAFKKVLEEYDHLVVKKFIDYFKVNFGTSRYHLTRVFLEVFLNEKFDEEKYQNILKDYGSQCVSLYKEVDFTPNFLNFLKKYNQKTFYIASGSDELELKIVIHERDILQYFNGVYGSPIKKTELVKNICCQYPTKKLLMIGDAESDLKAALSNNIDFIFMTQFSVNQKMKEDKTLVMINNLGDLL